MWYSLTYDLSLSRGLRRQKARAVSRQFRAMEKNLIITIDGPAGAGKSTVSKTLARELSYIYLDTGALYRAFAYKALKEGVTPCDKKGLADLCSRVEMRLENIKGNLNVFVDGENVTKRIRNEEVGLAASTVSAVAEVRERLLSIQRDVGENGCVVAEGRDMGTVVFPDADYKFYLDADVEERIKRRYAELLLRGSSAGYKAIAADLVARDRQDRERDIAPLKASEDAIIIDSTRMTVAEVVYKMISIIVSGKA